MATLAENITQAVNDFDGIQAAIINKGVDVPQGTPTSQYADKIGEISGGGGGDSSEWRPNPQWVTMPPMPPEGEQKIYCVIAVRKEMPFYAVYATTSAGQYRVDWGDGVTTLHDSGTLAEYTYNYESVTSEVTDLGYKTALVTITSVTPDALRTLNFYTSHLSDTRLNKSSPLLFMRGRVPYVTGFSVNTSNPATTAWRNSVLEGLDILDSGSVTNNIAMLHTASSLQWFPQWDSSSVTAFNNFMINCISIRKVPRMDFGKTSGLLSIYGNNTLLRIIDEFHTGASTTAISLFSGCAALEIVRNLICPNVVSVDNTFSGCYSLRVLRVTMGNVTTSFNVSNTALNREALVNLFGDLYDRTAMTAGAITITGCLGVSALTAADKLIATSKNWTIVE